MDSEELRTARSFSSRLRQELGPRLISIRAFGSRVRGEARPDSDLDIAVVLDSYDRNIRNQVLDLAWELNARSGYSPAVSPLVMGEDEYRDLLARERRLVLDIEIEGIPLDP